MRAKNLFRVLLTIGCIICIHENITANSLPLDLRMVPDSSNHDGNAHGRDKIPARRHVIPYVEYDSDRNSLTFESTDDQILTYFIEQKNRSIIQHGEIHLQPDIKYTIYLNTLLYDEEYYLYIWINDFLYIGEIKQ